MQAELCALLAAHEGAGGFMQDDEALSPDLEAQWARLKPEGEGERIGRYKLLQEIGEGGFGTVWMAEQMEPVSRRVALKIIKLGHGHARGHRALRERTAGAGDDGSPEHREGLRCGRDAAGAGRSSSWNW